MGKEMVHLDSSQVAQTISTVNVGGKTSNNEDITVRISFEVIQDQFGVGNSGASLTDACLNNLSAIELKASSNQSKWIKEGNRWFFDLKTNNF